MPNGQYKMSASIRHIWMELSINMKFILQRRSTYYIFVIIVPAYTIVTVCLLGVFTPTTTQFERNEKVCFRYHFFKTELPSIIFQVKRLSLSSYNSGAIIFRLYSA